MKELNGVYITNYNLADTSSGVSKKISMQIKAMKEVGLKIEVPDFSTLSFWEKVWNKMPYFSTVYDYKVKEYIYKINIKELDFVYIRHGIVTRTLLNTLKYLQNFHVKILYEIPTFPYDRNENKLINFFIRKKDKKWRNELYHYVDFIVDYSFQKEIFGIKCIDINNGIDTSCVKPHNKKPHKEVVFIGVALLTYWNGYDRLIYAIRKYYDEDYVGVRINVKFHIAGKGDEYKPLRELVHRLHLEDKVILHGFVNSQELDDLYDQCDIGVGTLAHFRKYKYHVMSTLKTKEYTAKGIPFLKADPDPVFDQSHLDFIYSISANEEEIILKDVIAWYQNLLDNSNQQELNNRIRNFAESNLSWKKQLQPVIDYIKRGDMS